jgi:AcrR family transcriptional regulator
MEKRKSKAGEVGDHRSRVGRQRASRTEARILAAALGVFAEKGPDAPVVDDFIKAAGIARGTFYNYFDSVERLLEATSVWTTGATVAAITDAMEAIEDPAHRVGSGFRLFLGKASADPVWALFIARVWKLGDLAELEEDLERGRALGRFRIAAVEVAMDVLLGGVREALFRIGGGGAPAGYVEQVVAQSLQGLGVAPGRIGEILRRPLPALPEAAAPDRRRKASGRRGQGVRPAVTAGPDRRVPRTASRRRSAGARPRNPLDPAPRSS